MSSFPPQQLAVASPPAQSTAPVQSSGQSPGRRIVAPVAILLPVVAALALDRPREAVPKPRADAPRAERLDGRIDPNTAPWWALAALPTMGEITARSIVAYRDAQPGAEHRTGAVQSGFAHTGDTAPFSRAEDLDAVRGIGPKTVERLRPYLAFRFADASTTR